MTSLIISADAWQPLTMCLVHSERSLQVSALKRWASIPNLVPVRVAKDNSPPGCGEPLSGPEWTSLHQKLSWVVWLTYRPLKYNQRTRSKLTYIHYLSNKAIQTILKQLTLWCVIYEIPKSLNEVSQKSQNTVLTTNWPGMENNKHGVSWKTDIFSTDVMHLRVQETPYKNV